MKCTFCLSGKDNAGSGLAAALGRYLIPILVLTGVPSIVYVFPEPVCPQAKRHMLQPWAAPERTSVPKSWNTCENKSREHVTVVLLPTADLELFFNLKLLQNVSNTHKFSTISQESIRFQKKIAKEKSFTRILFQVLTVCWVQCYMLKVHSCYGPNLKANTCKQIVKKGHAC